MPAEASPGRRWLVRRTALAVVAAVAVNAAVLRAGTRLVDLPAMYGPAAPGPVVVPAAAAVIAGGVSARLRGRDDGYRVYLAVLGVGLFVSFAPILVAAWLFALSEPAVAVLAALHVAVAATLAVAFHPGRGRGR